MRLHSFIMSIVLIVFGCFSLAASCIEEASTSDLDSPPDSPSVEEICQTGCSLYQECADSSANLSECQTECEVLFEDEDYCYAEWQDYMTCVFYLDCDEVYYGDDFIAVAPNDDSVCEGESDALLDCMDDECCGEGDPCEWANDGECDC
jgi:hypothetical protein